MLKDADPHSFKEIYVVCGRTDMRLGMDSLAAIIESRYHLPIFVPGTLFLFCGRRLNKITYGKETVFFSSQNVWKVAVFHGHAHQRKPVLSLLYSLTGL